MNSSEVETMDLKRLAKKIEMVSYSAYIIID